MPTTTLPLDALLDLIQPDPRALAAGRRRMIDVWHDRPTDSLPILFGSTDIPEGIAWNSDLRRHVEDAEQMLYDTAAGLVCLARAGSDAQLAVRANTGTGTLASIAGCKLLPSEVSLPWTGHLTPNALDAFDPTVVDFAAEGVMPRVRELYRFFRAHLPECVQLFCADTQSPFDLAHLLYGNDLFYVLYDDPGYAHRLLEKATTLYIEGTRVIKSWIGESLDGGYHMNLALANGGVRSCEDTATLLAPEMLDVFVHPYRRRALAAFGGGWVHYCGDNAALLAGILAEPLVRGLNFGNPERHDFSVIIPALIDAGKCYCGSIPRGDDETLDAYFRRVIGYTGGARKGLIFMPILHADESANPPRVLETWRAMQ